MRGLPADAAPPLLLEPAAQTQSPGTAAEPVERKVSFWDVRRAIGTMRLKSTLVTLDQPEPDVFRFMGRGFGHGLGLCQIGANGMAQRGYGFRRILAHYYPGTRVAPLGEG